MNILAGLTVKGLGYACIALAIALALSIGGWTMHAGALDKRLTIATEAQAKAEAQLADCQGNNLEWETAAGNAERKRAECVAQQKQQELDEPAALALAQAGKDQAERDLAAFRRVWADVTGVCTNALANMQHACSVEIPDY